jgi:vacuolar protein sorting-associated protein 13A/C
LGEFVVLAPEHLSVGLASGQVNVSGLRFREEALRDLNLPITVKQGILGHLNISIPWTSIWSSPTSVVIEDVYLLAVTKTNVFDEDFETRIQATKERFLQMRELFKSKDPEEEASNNDDKGKKNTWTSRLIAAIVNNVQVTVNRVHIRFEEASFACGISLDSVAALSCDENFEPKLASSAGGIVRKLCAMEALSVYWDSNAKPLQYVSPDDFSQQMRDLIKDTRHQYIVRPLSGKLHATINEEPKVKLEAMFDHLEVSLHDVQFQNATSLGERFSLDARGAPYRRLRPARPASPREMWHFLFAAIKQDLAVRRSVWKYPWLQALLNDRRDYVHLWSQVRVLGGVDKLPILDQEKLRALEYRLEYDSIVQFRDLGDLLYEKKLALAEDAMVQAQNEGGWLGRVVWGTPQAEKQRVLEQDIPVTGTLLQDLNRTLLARADMVVDRPQDREGMAANIKIKKIGVGLRVLEPISLTTSDLVLVDFAAIGAHISLGASKVFRFDMAGLSATEFVSVPGVATRTITQRASLHESNSIGGPLVSIAVELNPPSHKEADVGFKLETRAVDILFSMPMVDRLIKFFTSVESLMLDQLLAQASETVASVQRQVVNQVRGIASGVKPTRLNLQIKVDAPNVVVPADFINPDCPRAVAVLGKIRFNSILVNEESVMQYQKDGKTHISMDYFYQQGFSLSVNHINLLICNQEDWRTAMKTVARSEILKVSLQKKNFNFSSKQKKKTKNTTGFWIEIEHCSADVSDSLFAKGEDDCNGRTNQQFCLCRKCGWFASRAGLSCSSRSCYSRSSYSSCFDSSLYSSFGFVFFSCKWCG